MDADGNKIKSAKKSKNLDIDTMGDKVGRIHVGTQDLGKLQSRKMKGLKGSRKAGAEGAAEEKDNASDLETEVVTGGDDGISMAVDAAVQR